MLDSIFASEAVQKALEVLKTEIPLAIWETVYVTVLSTFFSIVIGLPLGVLLHRYVVAVADSVDLMLGRQIFTASFLIAAAVTLAFSFIVDLLMLIKLRRIKMAESLKAAD